MIQYSKFLSKLVPNIAVMYGCVVSEVLLDHVKVQCKEGKCTLHC